MRPTRWLVLVLATITVAATGCARVSEGGVGPVRQLVTAGYGAVTLSDRTVPDGRSAMDALRGVTVVETAFGGGFVNGMFDRRADAGRKADWFYYVNGVSPGHGADQQTLHAGDVIWWDYRRWGGLVDAWAVVGAWPEPFVHGYPAKPSRVVADAPLDEALRTAGATVVTGDSPWRVVVGADRSLRERDPAWRRAMTDPVAWGLTVRIDGGTILALRPDGTGYEPVAGARAVAAAVISGDSPDAGGVVLAVAGLDEGAAKAAATRIATEPGVLTGRYAVVFDGAGNPVAAGGQGGR